MEPKETSKEGLRVAIGLPSAVMLVMGGMVGVGIFVNPSVVARSMHSPSLVLSAWVLGGLVAVLGAVTYAELAARMPSTGGEYVYLRDTYGPLPGFLFGWTTLLVVQAGGMAAVAIVFAKNLNVLLGGRAPDAVVVVGALLGLAVVNCLGVRSGNRVQGWLGAIRITAILALIFGGLLLVRPALTPVATLAAPTSSIAFLKAFGAGMIPVVFSYGGWQTANYVTGEMKNPRRNLGLALIGGVLAVMALYLLVNEVCLRVLGIAGLAATLTPASDVLNAVVGPIGAKVAAAAIALSAMAFLSQGMLTGPRVYFAMARDGLFFRKVAEIAETSRAPVIAIILQAGWTAILALSGSYEQILSYTVAMNFLFFGLSASCLFVLRRRDRELGQADAPTGFRSPWHPYGTGLFIFASIAVVASSFWAYPVNSVIGYAIMFLGVPPYLYWRRQSAKETSKAL